jgi:hypothetical protein
LGTRYQIGSFHHLKANTMKDQEKSVLDDAILSLERQIMDLATMLSKANSKLEEIRVELEQLKSLRDGKRAEAHDRLASSKALSSFFSVIPASVRDRVILLADELEEADDVLLARLCEEARALLLYDAIYADVDDEYDLPNTILSRAVRGCVDHSGQVPMGADRASLLYAYPKIVDAIESSYRKHTNGLLKK